MDIEPVSGPVADCNNYKFGGFAEFPWIEA